MGGCVYNLIHVQDDWVRIGVLLMLLGVANAWFRWRRLALSEPLPTFESIGACLAVYRRELERKRDLNRTFWNWHLMPMVPGIIVRLGCSYFGNPMTSLVASPWRLAAIVLLWFAVDLLRAHLNATEYQRELVALSATESTHNQSCAGPQADG
jgi:hypothetical protein